MIWMDIPGGSPIYILPREGPACPTHGGHMKLKFSMDLYECMGYDGEGCDYTIMVETMLIEIGTTDSFRFEL
jgi:hypothetical protein